MADIAKFAIVKLNNGNYFTWKYKVELFLIRADLWSVVSEERPGLAADASNQTAVNDWIRQDDRARASIGLLVEDDQLCHIRSQTTAKGAWLKLKEFHEKDTMTNRVGLMRKICRSILSDDGDMEAHLFEMTKWFQQLTDLGGSQLEDRWKITMLLSSLPHRYDTLTTALETRSDSELTMSYVQSKLIDEYNRQRSDGGPSVQSGKNAVLRTTSERELTCFFCKCVGHMKRDCEKYDRWKKSRDKHSKGNSNKEKANKVENSDEFLFRRRDMKIG